VIAQGKVQVYHDRAEIVQPRVQVYERDAVLAARGDGPKQVASMWQPDHQVPLIRKAVAERAAQTRLPVERDPAATLLAKRRLPGREDAIRQITRRRATRRSKRRGGGWRTRSCC